MSISEEDLLNMAKGVTETPFEEPDEKKKLREHFTREIPSSKEILRVRKELRREILQMNFWAGKSSRGTDRQFKSIFNEAYKKGNWSDKREVIYEIINKQLDSNSGLTWETFTHTWDLHPKRQFEIIRKEFWPREGGQYDEIGACFPIAFTSQGFD